LPPHRFANIETVTKVSTIVVGVAPGMVLVIVLEVFGGQGMIVWIVTGRHILVVRDQVSIPEVFREPLHTTQNNKRIEVYQLV
jgi:hypothetical protein